MEKSISKTDANKEAQDLFMGTIPEQHEVISQILKRVQFERANDKPALCLEANAFFGRGLVVFTNRTMQQMWLIAYLSWRTLHEQSGFIIVSQKQNKPYNVALNDKNDRYIMQVDRLEEALAKLRTAETGHTPWPKDVPRLDPKLTEIKGVEDRATYDLGCFAVSFVLLHEANHAQKRIINEEYEGIKEELECDSYAINLILDDCKSYAAENKCEVIQVYRKRAIGIFLGLATILESTELGSWLPPNSHPSVYERILQFYEIVVSHVADDNDDFWLFGSCVLLSKARRDGRLPESIEFDTFHSLFFELLKLFRHDK